MATVKPDRGEILINRTYSTVSPESAENGDIADAGFISENESISFRSLVEILRNAESVSCSPASGSIYEWADYETDTDYESGCETTGSIHYSSDNPARKARYWKRAFLFAGLIK